MASQEHRAIEAVLMVAEEPIAPGLLAQLLEVTPARVDEICEELARAYEVEDRGFVMVRVAGGWRFQSHEDLADYVERFVVQGQSARLSAAALETLAIVAYKQPVSRRAGLGDQRSGSRCRDAHSANSWVHRRVGRDAGPGQALLYSTTDRFLERLGIDSLKDLPPLGDFVPEGDLVSGLERELLGRL